jgi:hypothetical protein
MYFEEERAKQYLFVLDVGIRFGIFFAFLGGTANALGWVPVII